MLECSIGGDEAELDQVTSDAHGECSYNYAVVWKLGRILSIGWHAASRADNIASDGLRPSRFLSWRAVMILTATGLEFAAAGRLNIRRIQRGIAFDDYTSDAGRLGRPRRSGRGMTPPDDRTSPGTCDADTNCLHVPCFQVQLDVSSRRQAHRQASACAYHVADVIQALRAWAGEHGVIDGELTILAIEPAAGGRQPSGAGHRDQRGFAFSTIPLA